MWCSGGKVALSARNNDFASRLLTLLLKVGELAADFWQKVKATPRTVCCEPDTAVRTPVRFAAQVLDNIHLRPLSRYLVGGRHESIHGRIACIGLCFINQYIGNCRNGRSEAVVSVRLFLQYMQVRG